MPVTVISESFSEKLFRIIPPPFVICNPVEAGTYTITDNEDGTVTVSVPVTNYTGGEGVTAQLIIASYNGTRMTLHVKSDVTSIEEGKKATLSQTVTVNAGEKVIAYLWNSLDKMVPITPAQIIAGE